MSHLSIDQVSSSAQMMEFITFPWKVYAQDPYWVPPLLSERKDFHDPAKNPFFQHATVAYFLARRAGQPIPRPSSLLGLGMMWKWTWKTAWCAGAPLFCRTL